MGFFDDVVSIVTKVVDQATGAIGTAIAELTSRFADIGYSFAEFIDEITRKTQEALGNVLPDEVAQWIGLYWYLLETQLFYGAAFLQNFSNAVRTGKYGDILDVITPAVVIAMRLARDEARHNALFIPIEVLNRIPDYKDYKYVQESVKYTTIARIDNKRFFYIWSKLKGDDTKAITLLNIIVLAEPPDFQNNDTIFRLLHEIKHTLQFRDLGENQFMQKYLLEKITKHDPPSFEIEADQYACKILPNGNPSYIASC